MSHIRKRAGVAYYKDMKQYHADWQLMFNNARTYNQEGSWVYNDAEEMEKVLEAAFHQQTYNSGLPGAEGTAAAAPPPMSYGGDASSSRQRGRIIQSDDEYNSASDDD